MTNLNLKTHNVTFRKSPSNALLPYLKRWAFNDPNKLGVVQFYFDLEHISKQLNHPPIVKNFNPAYGVAPWAYKSLKEVYKYYPNMTREDRAYAIETYRGGSKTFWFSYVCFVYDVLVGQYGIYWKNNLLPEADYQVLRAKSGNEARKRFLAISSFFNKPVVQTLFGELKPTFQEIKKKDARDASNMLILSNGYILEASGIDQPIRGSNVMQVRPKKIVFDDPQNRLNTKTPGRREQCDMEVMQESFGAVDDYGMIVFIGNRVHEDDTLSKLMDKNNVAWKKFRYAITIKKDGSPGDGDLDNEVAEWSQRYTIERIRKIKEWYKIQPKLGGIRGFYKEYFNILLSSANYEIKYHDGIYFNEFGTNWLKIDNEILNVNIFIGIDPAISKRKSSSDAAIAVLAVDYRGNRYVLEYSVGKFELFDKPLKEYQEEVENTILIKDKYKLDRIGTANESCRLALKYKADAICFESGVGVQEVFLNTTKELLDKLGIYIPIAPFAPRESKEEKLRQIPLGYVENGKYYIRKNMTELESEIISFGEGSRKDILDAVHNAEIVLRIPEKIVYNPLGLIEHKESKKNTSLQPIVSNGLVNDYEPWIVF
ncbi:hypothetical protein [Ignavibacterium sp.]|uniref:hypothetical protein n=1 Tax=Ignavibacterium sp. TaxID=2651167 RepID=UPI00307D7213